MLKLWSSSVGADLWDTNSQRYNRILASLLILKSYFFTDEIIVSVYGAFKKKNKLPSPNLGDEPVGIVSLLIKNEALYTFL